MKILIIEDEPALNESILFYLKNEGFVCETALNYNEASQKINDYNYDLIVVDIMLPDGSGLNIVRELKASYLNTGIIILSAKDSLDDKLLGLDLGADDYITKPFHLAELNSFIKPLPLVVVQLKGSTVVLVLKELLIHHSLNGDKSNGCPN